MDKFRLFIAIEFSETLVQKVAIFQQKLYKNLVSYPIRWVLPSNFHITLQFLGEINQDKLQIITQSMNRAVVGCDQFSIRIGGTGCYPSLRKPEVIWLGLDHNPSLIRLANTLSQELMVAELPGNNKLSPHLTLARVSRDAKETDRKQINELVLRYQFIEIGMELIHEIVLFRSILTSSGPIYTPLHRSSF